MAGTEVCGHIDFVSKGCITSTENGEYGSRDAEVAKLVVQGTASDIGMVISFFVIPPGTVGSYADGQVTFVSGDVQEVA